MNGQIRVHTENIFPIIKKFLYSDHDIFLRELISNAVDATQKLKTYSSAGEAKGELGDLRIDISIDPASKTLTIDNRKGSFNNVLQKRIFRINIFSPGKTRSLDFDNSYDKQISYEGKLLLIKI